MDLAVIRPMIGAEILRLRRNRAIMIVAGLLTIGILLLAYGVSALQHASNPAQNGPAGGEAGFSTGVKLLGVFFGALAAAMIGSEAGTADVSSGVFRDLVATGRSRLELFFVRLPAAVIVTFAFNLLGLLVAAVLSLVFADGLPNATVSEVLQAAAWLLLCNTIVCAFAVGVGSATSSRSVSLIAVIGWQAVATPLLLHIHSLGSLRDLILMSALGQVMPVSGEIAGITMATGVAVLVMLGWFVIPYAIGAWSTATRDA